MGGRIFSVKFTGFVIFLVTGIIRGDDSLVGEPGIENDLFQLEDPNSNAVSTVSEKSTVFLKNERGKCVEYLETNLKEFLQKNTPPTNKVSFLQQFWIDHEDSLT